MTNHLILTHPNADFDAIASLLAAHKLHPDATPVMSRQQNRNVREFLALYQNGLPFVRTENFNDWTIEHVLLVDTQRLPEFKNLPRDVPLSIIDHHPRQPETPESDTIFIEEIGANATLLVERLQEAHITLNSLEATLLALGIYEDTGSLTYGTTTPRDARAAAWLMEQHADLDVVRKFLVPPLTAEQQAIYEQLLQTADSRVLQGYPITVAQITLPEHTAELAAIAHRLGNTLEAAALFMVIAMPDYVQLIARSADEAIDAGAIAGLFDGGGHSRAAAAAIHDESVDSIARRLWDALQEHIRPTFTIADLMSSGVQTVKPEELIGTIISRLRRVGHEGYPVVDNGRVVGLLKLRDADRALEHGLKNAPVREIMEAGEITLTPEDSVFALEQIIVDSGWGQIPVMQNGKLTGIVTRTDLIKHWARTHPTPAKASPTTHLTHEQIQMVLGEATATLIQALAGQAQAARVSLYLVGGVVRDLLLKRPNFDIDFVVEQDAIAFAQSIQKAYGGEISTHPAFRTAKWHLNAASAAKLGVDLAKLPATIDFATARNEFYEHPTALPTVYTGSIKLDLQRRDFTINTLAVQLSPGAGRVLDFYGGLNDLQAGLMRVLHSLSFVDDPTRILRAVRFAQRLHFQIETRTADLISTSREMLRRITGERVRNELTLLLSEAEPERGLLDLQARGALVAIHPALRFDDAMVMPLQQARDTEFMQQWTGAKFAQAELYWHLWLAQLAPAEVNAIGERLLIAKGERESIHAAAVLLHQPERLAEAEVKPSQVVARLEGLPEIALQAVWLLTKNPITRDYIRQYLNTWRQIRPITTGHTLKALGLPPGPLYRKVLDRLRSARLNGEIQTDAEEQALLQALIAGDQPT